MRNYFVNLSDGFKPFNNPVSMELVKTKDAIWSGGEINLRFDMQINAAMIEGQKVTITTRLNNSDDILRLLMATNYIKSCLAGAIELFIPYVPYARQDRVCHVGEPFSLKAFAALINAQGYSRVWMFDPHSNVAPALIDNSSVIPGSEFVYEAIRRNGYANLPMVLVAPDKGAAPRTLEAASRLTRDPSIPPFMIVHASKERDESGQPTVNLPEGLNISGRAAYITDDICDGGRSFFPLAKLLKERGAARVVLIVSHGIFSYGFLNVYMANGIDKVITTDSIAGDRSYGSASLHTIPLSEVI